MAHNTFVNFTEPSALYEIIFPPEIGLMALDKIPDPHEGNVFEDSNKFKKYITINGRHATVTVTPPYDIFTERNPFCLANEESGGDNAQFIKYIGDFFMGYILREIEL